MPIHVRGTTTKILGILDPKVVAVLAGQISLGSVRPMAAEQKQSATPITWQISGQC